MKTRRKWIKCDSCKKHFHYKFIPKRHLETFGLEESDDDEEEVVCHNCTKNYLYNDEDPLVLSETSDED